MLIKSIKIHNFRNFQDVSIEFSTHEFKNVTVIMGDNGSGKTTLAQAFQWVLYNETHFKKKGLLNAKVADNLFEGQTVPMSVTLDIEYNHTDYIIKRKEEYKRVRNGLIVDKAEFLVAEVVDGNTTYLPEHKKNYLIRRILPKDLSRFFFFDGETMDDMAEELDAGSSEEFKKAVEGIVGLKATQNAIQHLDASNININPKPINVVSEYEKKISKNSKSIKALNNINVKMEEKLSRKDELERRNNQLKNQYTDTQKQIDELNDIVIRESPEFEKKKKYEKVTNDIRRLESTKINQIKDSLIKPFQKDCYGFFATPIFNEVGKIKELNEGIHKTIPKLTRPTLKYIIEQGECICGTKFEVGDQIFTHITDLMNYVPPKTLGQLLEDYDKQRNVLKASSEGFWNTFVTAVKTIRDTSAQIEGMTSEQNELFNSLSNNESGETAKKKLNELKPELEKIHNNQVRVEAELVNIDKDIANLISDKNKYINIDESSSHDLLLLAYAKRLVQMLKEDYAKKEKQTRYNLQVKINEIFADLYDGNIKINVDEKYKIYVNAVDDLFHGSDIEKNTAQKYAIIFAFISAVIDLAKHKANDVTTDEKDIVDLDSEGYPLVMDAPLSAFDKTRILNICDALPRIADQVIIFIKDTDGEIAEQYLGDKVGKRYLINKDNNLNSTIEAR